MKFINQNKGWAISFILLVVLNIATLTAFWIMQDKRPLPPKNLPNEPVDFLVKELGFDSLQKKQLLALRDEHRQQIRKIREENREAKNAFFALLRRTDITDASIDSAAKASAYYDQQTDIITFRHFQKIRNLCTAVQQEKFASIIQEVLRMMAPQNPGRPNGPPPGGEPGGPSADNEQRRPPPAQQ
ncbi:MAG: hypothetical protein RLZZ28_669 [Bacteroidota bacterium]|jgi:Spy/CpxP family protein refolding chaperone